MFKKLNNLGTYLTDLLFGFLGSVFVVPIICWIFGIDMNEDSVIMDIFVKLVIIEAFAYASFGFPFKQIGAYSTNREIAKGRENPHTFNKDQIYSWEEFVQHISYWKMKDIYKYKTHLASFGPTEQIVHVANDYFKDSDKKREFLIYAIKQGVVFEPDDVFALKDVDDRLLLALVKSVTTPFSNEQYEKLIEQLGVFDVQMAALNQDVRIDNDGFVKADYSWRAFYDLVFSGKKELYSRYVEHLTETGPEEEMMRVISVFDDSYSLVNAFVENMLDMGAVFSVRNIFRMKNLSRRTRIKCCLPVLKQLTMEDLDKLKEMYDVDLIQYFQEEEQESIQEMSINQKEKSYEKSV